MRKTKGRSRNKYGLKFVNRASFPKFFYRYMPYGRLKELLNSKELVFVYPSLWNDPYETIYLNTDFTALNNFKQKKIFCLCGRIVTDNEDALWKVYSDGQEPLIRVKFSGEKLFSYIRNFAVKNNCNTYCSKISYDLSKNAIRNISRDPKRRKEYLGVRFTEKKYITLMSLKRKDFEYEKEYRLFIVPRDDRQPIFKNNIVRIPIDYSVFDGFIINPLGRIKKEDKDSTDSKIKKAIYEINVEDIKRFIHDKISDANVDCCDLYKNVRPIRIIRQLVEKNGIP